MFRAVVAVSVILAAVVAGAGATLPGSATSASTAVRASGPIKLGATILLGSRTRTKGCKQGPLPDRRCSPGAYESGLTKAAICSSSFRASSLGKMPDATKRAVEVAYGLAPRSYGRALEIDLIVPREIGGSNAVANLFPEKAGARTGYQAKNKLESKLHSLVCQGKMSLPLAQRRSAENWQALYGEIFGASVTPKAGSGGTGGKGMAGGLIEQTITSNSHTRHYLTYKPTTLNDQVPGGVPLIIYLHGSMSTNCDNGPSIQDTINCVFGGTSIPNGSSYTAIGTTCHNNGELGCSGWVGVANAENAIAVFPSGAPEDGSCINDPEATRGRCRVWFGLAGLDTTFLKDMITQIETSQSIGANINPSKIYIGGFSAGASTVMRIAFKVARGASNHTNDGWEAGNGLTVANEIHGFQVQAGALLGLGATGNANETPNPVVHYGTNPQLLMLISSKGDNTVSNDPAWSRTVGHHYCPVTDTRTNCQLRVTSELEGFTGGFSDNYKQHWSCAPPTHTAFAAGGAYVTNDQYNYDSCTGGNGTGHAEWLSLGTGNSSSTAPSHSLVNYNTACGARSCAQRSWDFWARTKWAKT